MVTEQVIAGVIENGVLGGMLIWFMWRNEKLLNKMIETLVNVKEALMVNRQIFIYERENLVRKLEKERARK